MSFRFICMEKHNHRVALLCRVLRVSHSGYYAWATRGLSDHAASDIALAAQISAIHRESDVEAHRDVVSYVKERSPRFRDPLRAQGTQPRLRADCLVRLADQPDSTPRALIVEVSGGRKSPGPTEAKANTARWQWCVAVNNHGGFGHWRYVELTDMETASEILNAVITDMLTATSPVGATS